MEDHHFIDAPEPPHHIRYNLIFSEDTREIISLLAPSLFDSHVRHGYSIILPPDIISYKNELAAVENDVQPWDTGVPQPIHTSQPS